MGVRLDTDVWDVLGDSEPSGSSALGSSTSTSSVSLSSVFSSSSGGMDPAQFRSLLICSIVAFGLYALLALAGLVQYVRLVRVRYLPRFVVQKAYALLLLIAALCLRHILPPFPLCHKAFFTTPPILHAHPHATHQCARCSLFCCR